jgi:hypothetical protein
MKIIWIFIGFTVLISILFFAGNGVKRKFTKPLKPYRYSRKSLMTENEQNMYWRLIETLPNHVVLAQVEMSSCVGTEGLAAFNTISGKSFDFVVCDKAMNILAAIEIDDKSHTQEPRVKADKTKSQALDMAGIKLIRWPAVPLPSRLEIVKALANAVAESKE